MQYPYATSQAPRYLLPHLHARARVGRLNASAVSDLVFRDFGLHVHQSAVQALSQPYRLIPLSHLCNAIAQSDPNLPDATRPLIEGYVYQLVVENVLTRLTTVSRSYSDYGIYSVALVAPLIEAFLVTLGREVLRVGKLSERKVEALLPLGLQEYRRNAGVLMGVLAARGYANISFTDDCAWIESPVA